MFVVLMIVISTAVPEYEALDRLVHPRPPKALAAVRRELVGLVGNELIALYRVGEG